jgi:hypothetical protein
MMPTQSPTKTSFSYGATSAACATLRLDPFGSTVNVTLSSSL